MSRHRALTCNIDFNGATYKGAIRISA